MTDNQSTEFAAGTRPNRSDETVTWPSVLNVLLGVGLISVALFLHGPPPERLDTAAIGLLVAFLGGFNLYRIERGYLRHPDVSRVVEMSGLWLIAFSLSRSAETLGPLTAVSLGGAAVLLVGNTVDFFKRFKNRPERRTLARHQGVGLPERGAVLARSSLGRLRGALSGEPLVVLALSVPVGIGAGIGSGLFRALMYAVHGLLFGTVLPGLPSDRWIVLLPIAGAAVAGVLIYEFAPEAAGHGVPENMEAIADSDGRIRHRLAPFKVLVSALTLGAGGSGGREGPIARIGAGVGSSLGQLFGLSAENTRLLLAAGIAGGIGATFGAVLGGILFGIEIVMLYRVKLFNVVVLAATTLVAVATAEAIAPRFTWFTFLPFRLPELTVTPRTVLYALPYGLLLGILAWTWVTLLEWTERRFDGLDVPAHTKPALGAIPVGVLGLFYAKYGVMGVGYEGLRLAVTDVGLGATLLLTLALSKLVATQFTIGSGGSGGVFAPTLYIGGLFAVGVHQSVGALPVSSAMLGVVGMGAIFSGAAFAPLTATFLVAEIFDNYALAAVLAVPCLSSYLVARELLSASIYTSRLHRRGILDTYPETAARIGPTVDGEPTDHGSTRVSADE